MPTTLSPTDNLTFVDPSPVARRLLWHLFSIGTRRIEQPDRHDRFEKPGAHLINQPLTAISNFAGAAKSGWWT